MYRPQPLIYVERTLALLKPDIVDKAEIIEDLIVNSGLIILQKRIVQMSPEQCSDFYAEHQDKPFFSNLTAFMSSGPVITLMLAGQNAVARWKSMIGPPNVETAVETQPLSLRAIYGTSELKNGLHGSESIDAAVREIKFFYPTALIEPFPSKNETEEYMSKKVHPVLLRGLTALCEAKPLDPGLWLADWLMENNPNQPQVWFGRLDKEKMKN